MAIQNGTVLNQRYKIIKRLGAGGMAQVFLAEDLKNGRKVAIKALKTELNDDEEFVRRFDAEARAASSLAHENIVKVLGVGVDRGVRYMVQEFVDGVSLKAMINHYHRLDWRVAVPLFVQIAMALESAHAGGVIHRDIKPHNILIGSDHRAMVTDFGIARANSATTITQAGGTTLGSVHYFSPEQARGSMAGEKSDIYSLGILMYETLTGRLPFDDDNPVAIAIKHLQKPAIPPNELEPVIPQGLSDIVMRCIEKAPSDRYETARELINELDAFTINPQGTYGITLAKLRKEKPEVSLVPITEEKLIEFEKKISDRKSSRRRETGAVLAIVLLSVAFAFCAIVYFVQYIGKQIQDSEDAIYKMPNFVGWDISQAEEELNKNNIAFTIREEYSDSFDENKVISQSIPAGEKMGGHSISRQELKVSKGSNLVDVIEYSGQDGDEVVSKLKELGLVAVKVREINNEVEEGKVIATNPQAGSILKIGETIEVVVSSGTKDVHINEFHLYGYTVADVIKKLESEDIVVKQVITPEGLTDNNSYVADILDMAQNSLLWNDQIVLQSGDSVTVVGKPWTYFHPENNTNQSDTN